MSEIPVEELKALKELHDEGVISDDEFSALKRRLLNLSDADKQNMEDSFSEIKSETEQELSGEAEPDQVEGYDIVEEMMKPQKDFINKMENILSLGEEGFLDALLSDQSPLGDILNAKASIEADTLPYSIAEEEYEKLTSEDKAYLKSIADNPEEIAALHFTYGTDLRNNYKLWNSYDADEVSSSIISLLIQKAVADESVVVEPKLAEETVEETPPTLDVAKELLYQEYSVENIRTFAESFLNYANNNKPVPTYFQIKNDTRLYTLLNRGIVYNAIASCRELESPHPECTTIEMDINYVISSIFGSSNVGGLAIDPFQPIGLYLPKDMLLKILVHGMYEDQKNGGCENRDWGIGIPDYTEDDLMTEGELLNFAMQMVIDHDLNKNGYTIVSATDNTNAIANIVAKKDGEYHFIAVTGYCDNEEPEIDLERKLRLQSLGDMFNANCYYAPVGFRSASDLLRFNKCLALKGDAFYSKYTGIQEV